MGFNNHGSCSILKRIEKYYPKLNRPSPLGVNIGKAKSTPLESANELSNEFRKVLAGCRLYNHQC